MKIEIPKLKYLNSEMLLKNPDRGFRLETYITLGKNLSSYPGDGKDPFEFAKNEIKFYKKDSPTVVQAYVYLSNYNKKELDDLAFFQLEKYFKIFAKNKIRILLRFAYSTESTKDASAKWVLRHLTSIGNWFAKKEGLINKSVYAVQGGIVGLWGEGHSNVKLRNRHIAKVYDKLLEIVPKPLFVQIRTLDLLKQIDSKHASRLGMHQDYIIGDEEHVWGFGHTQNEELRAESEESFKLSVNDGELPWGRATYNDDPQREQLNALNGLAVAKEVAQYRLSTFSIKHNYKEPGPNPPYSLQRWKGEYVSAKTLKENNLPFNPFFFTQDIKMSMHEYLKYHLGYLLVISDVYVNDNKLGFRITNYGMSAPHNFSRLKIFTLDKKGTSEFEVDYFKPQVLQPMGKIDIELALKENIESKKIGIKLSTSKDPNTNIRFANEVPVIADVHWIYEN